MIAETLEISWTVGDGTPKLLKTLGHGRVSTLDQSGTEQDENRSGDETNLRIRLRPTAENSEPTREPTTQELGGTR